jgi:acyl-phosphate glycerol 3-phosphate acyltransferase
MITLLVGLVAAYLIGGVPFGYLIARAKGVDLFQVGSGNIGATNVGRALGRKFGILVFALDFLKGAVPVALAGLVDPASLGSKFSLDDSRFFVAIGVIAGHMFPIYLRFRGGKGVATGAGTVFVLVPGPALFALALWTATVVSTRMISLGSIIAAVGLVVARCVDVGFTNESFVVTLFCALAATIVVLKHGANIARILQGRENMIGDRPMYSYVRRAIHLLAISLWLGGSVFFNLLAAPTIFRTFDEVAKAEPGDRTAHAPINTGLSEQRKDQLGKALAGAAVGPLFPKFFALSAICATLALLTAIGGGRWRLIVIGLGLASVVANWAISTKVTELRLARFSPDSAIAAAATADFATWHLVSLALSFVTLLLALTAALLAAKVNPADPRPA